MAKDRASALGIHPVELEAIEAQLILAGVKADVKGLLINHVATIPGDSIRDRVQEIKRAMPSAFDLSVPFYPGTPDEALKQRIRALIDVLQQARSNLAPAPRIGTGDLKLAFEVLGPEMPKYFTDPESQGQIRVGMVSQPVPNQALDVLIPLLMAKV